MLEIGKEAGAICVRLRAIIQSKLTFHFIYMSTPPPQTLSLEAALQQAVEHHRAGRFQEAQNYYSAILHADPKHV